MDPTGSVGWARNVLKTGRQASAAALPLLSALTRASEREALRRPRLSIGVTVVILNLSAIPSPFPPHLHAGLSD